MKKYLIALLLPFIVGCTSSSLNQKFSIGYGLNKVSRQLNTDAVDLEIIGYDEGMKIRKIEDMTLDKLDAAWKIRLIYADSTKNEVEKINTTLADVLKTLESKGAK